MSAMHGIRGHADTYAGRSQADTHVCTLCICLGFPRRSSEKKKLKKIKKETKRDAKKGGDGYIGC